ncbi:hypothetical protein BD770DRAFT_394981 [Pilaira anomala]|nr:hypothetical protein BD770DRAFT_394981 [Pilaira anomala]
MKSSKEDNTKEENQYFNKQLTCVCVYLVFFLVYFNWNIFFFFFSTLSIFICLFLFFFN